MMRRYFVIMLMLSLSATCLWSADQAKAGDRFNAVSAATRPIDGTQSRQTTATVTLNATEEYYFPGNTVEVHVDMSDASSQITGGQFFLSFNTNKLQFVSMEVGGDPFVQEIFEVLGIGTIDYAVGVLQGNPGTTADSTMAIIRFTALSGICDTAGLVEFRPNTPPSQLTDSMGDPVDTTLVDMGAITIDGTLPSIICPSNLTIECTDSQDPADTGSASATDNCDAAPEVTYTDDITTTGCVGNYTIDRTWQAADDTGNIKQCAQTITVRDTTNPVITCPADITEDSEPGTCLAIIDPGNATGTDNCDMGLTFSATRDDGLPLVGEYESGTTQIFWEVTDCAGNTDSCTQTVMVEDLESPSITCPADIVVNADAGGTDAFVNIPPPPSVEDNCGILWVRNDYNGLANASDTYEQDDTVVTWTVTDVFGNESTCAHTVTVEPYNELVVSVQLSPTVASPLTRCITLDLHNCTTDVHETITQEITFNFGLALEQTVLVPAGMYDCISARDTLHTLRRVDDGFRIVGSRYVASFTGNVDTGGDWLIGGNFNDDIYVDILDFGALSLEWGAEYDSDGDTVADGNTDCATPWPHSDVSGDGRVTLADFSFIQIHFLKQSEAACCESRNAVDSGPVESIAVEDLPDVWADMAVADLDGNGILDANDLAMWMNGHRPATAPDKSKASMSVRD